MSFQRTYSGAPWEREVGYCPVLRYGALIHEPGCS